ncbi:hypothetical protein [Shewanella marina]|uniref:hypothetical protein n=1 Tax=Shewanella marina TaxID=487319 RepID=UPI00047194D4|nr:hypothetical protein [Shewanella marina]
MGWLKSKQRITVDNFDHAFRAVERGVGYCRLPKHIVEYRANTKVTVLAIEQAQQYQVPLHLTLPKRAPKQEIFMPCYYNRRITGV